MMPKIQDDADLSTREVRCLRCSAMLRPTAGWLLLLLFAERVASRTPHNRCRV